jgi:hypothetical protein
MRRDHAIEVGRQLRSADRLLTLGRVDDAQRVIDGALVYRDQLTEEQLVRSCGLLGRLLALRGDPVRARMFAALSVELARCTKRLALLQTASLDRACTLRLLGEGEGEDAPGSRSADAADPQLAWQAPALATGR